MLTGRWSLVLYKLQQLASVTREEGGHATELTPAMPSVLKMPLFPATHMHTHLHWYACLPQSSNWTPLYCTTCLLSTPQTTPALKKNSLHARELKLAIGLELFITISLGWVGEYYHSEMHARWQSISVWLSLKTCH